MIIGLVNFKGFCLRREGLREGYNANWEFFWQSRMGIRDKNC